MPEIEERGNLDARDRAAGRSCVVDGSVDATTLRGGGDRLPVGGRFTDAVLEQLLFANAGVKPGHRRHAEPDWAVLHREMRRKHVALSILWEEYITANPGGYRYSRFCKLYREWEGRLPVTMRQTHAPGERLFVDYAGDGVPVVIDRLTGEIRKAQIFVAVIGAPPRTATTSGDPRPRRDFPMKTRPCPMSVRHIASTGRGPVT